MAGDWTGWSDLPWEKLKSKIEQTFASLDSSEPDEGLTEVLLQRMTVSLRIRSRDELHEEASGTLDLSRLAKRRSANSFAAICETVARSLMIAAKRHDSSAVESLLRSYGKHGTKLLELLADAGENAVVPRKTLRSSLGVDNESQFSHLLRDFQKARLIYREQPQGSREVLVGLDVEGQEVVQRKMMQPDWILILVTYCETFGIGSNASEIAGKLLRCGFPTKHGAVEIGKAIVLGRERLVQTFASSKASSEFDLIDIQREYRSPDYIYKQVKPNSSMSIQSKRRSSTSRIQELSVY